MRVIVCAIALVFAGTASAQDKAAPPDMMKMGPMSRPVTKEDKKGIDALFKSMEDGWKRGDVNALAENVDFPVIMLSDDSAGQVKEFMASREQWITIMKPFTAKANEMKVSHKHTPHFLSDTLAVVISDDSVSSGPNKGAKWKSMIVATQKDGRWKIKEMAESGWGEMKPPTETAKTPGRTPTNTVPAR
jgi:hypothetical protein